MNYTKEIKLHCQGFSESWDISYLQARPSNQSSCAVHAVATSGCNHSQHHHHHHHHHHNHGHGHEHAHSHVNTGSSSIDSSVTSGETTATSQNEEEMETDKEKDSNEVTIEDIPEESNTNRQESRQDRSSAETQSQQDEYAFSCNYLLSPLILARNCF